MVRWNVFHGIAFHTPCGGAEGEDPSCFSCKMTDLNLLTSLVFLAVLGLKSHNLATLSHSVPGTN